MAKKTKLQSAQSAQQKQINRLNKLIASYERQGFSVSKRLKNQLKVTGKTAGKAKQKAERLKNIKASDVKKQLTGYTNDKGKIRRGKQAVKEGLKEEKKKRQQVKRNRISAIQNISNLVSSITDSVYYDRSGNNTGKNVDVSSIKRKVVDAWNNYTSLHKMNEMNVNVLNRVWGWTEDLQTPSQQENEYDDTAQKIINELEGAPMDADDIVNAESIDLIDIL